MKTADLIPLILLELNECDKYGLEMTKSIETKSNGKIIIKQPTLYTILKKLEKSKFISSYWEDSDIGGKRHYYKITDNGRLQVSTLPTMQELINAIITNEENTEESNIESESIDSNKIFEQDSSTKKSESLLKNDNKDEAIIGTIPLEEKEIKNTSSFSIMDMLIDDKPENVETVLPSEEVFANTSIDTTTQIDINQANKELLKDANVSKDEAFANNKDIAKFTEKPQVNPSPTQFMDRLNSNQDNLSPRISTQESLNINKKDIKYVDYIDIKKDKNYIYANKTAKNMLCKILSTTGYLVFILTLCAFTTSFLGTSALYNISIIIGVCITIFYPAIYAFKYQDIKQRLQQDKLKIDMKKRMILYVAIELLILIVIVILNISIGNGSIIKMFSFNNFTNFYAPVLISSAIFIDYLFTYIFLIRKKETESSKD